MTAAKALLYCLVVAVFFGVGWLGSGYFSSDSSTLVSPLAGIISVDTQSQTGNQSPTQPSVVLGFIPYWLLGKATTQYTHSVTEVTYFGLEIDSDGTVVRKVNPQEQEPGWTALNTGKFSDFSRNQGYSQPQQKSLLLHLSNEEKISQLLSLPVENAQTLVQEVVPILQEHSFGDLNIDIESFSLKTQEEQQSFTEFLKTVDVELSKRGPWTITLEITPASFFHQHLIDPVAVADIPDRFVLMAYDYHYRGSEITGPVAPVGGAPNVREFDVRMSVSKAVKILDPQKLLLGIPLYGYEWETLSSIPGSPVIPGSGKTASVRRMVEELQNCGECTVQFDSQAGQPYLVVAVPDQGYYRQIYFENAQSIELKNQLVREFGLSGVALWALGYEDPALLQPLAK